MQSMGPQSVRHNLMTEQQRRAGVLSHPCRAHIIIKKKKRATIFACPTWHGNNTYIYACICTFMRVKISKRFRMNWSGLQDFSEDLRESNKSLHFLSLRWVFNFSQRTNHLLFCVPWIHFLAKLCKNGKRDLQRHRHNCFHDCNHTTRFYFKK